MGNPIVIPNRRLRRLTLPAMGLGCYFFGHDPARRSHEITLIRLAYRLGIRHFDVAKRYGTPKETGQAELVVGEALSIYPRDSYVLVTKLLPEELWFADIERATRESLARLQTTYVDVIMPHNPPLRGGPRLEEVVEGLQMLKEKGLARAIGLSQFTLGAHLAQTIRLAPDLVEYVQLRHNLAFRDFQHDGTLAFCWERGILVVAYRPFYPHTVDDEPRTLLSHPHPNLVAVTRKHRRKQAQVCLQWLIQQEGIVTIFGTTVITHLLENLLTFDAEWELDAEDLALLKQIPRIDPDSK